MKHDLISRIEKAMPEMSKSQRAIGNYIIANYDKSAYLTASKLGAAVGVSESTVVRFAIELGYDGYPALQHALRELIRTRLTSVQRMEITNKRIGENSVLSTVLRSDMDKIKETLETVDPAAFEGAVDTLLGARTIYVMGVRMTGSLASFLTFGLSMIFPNVKQIQTSSGGEIFEQLLRVGEGDVIIPITFPRYSKRIVRGVEYARSYGAKVIALTDSDVSPVAEFADYLLTARSDMASFIDSLVAPLSIINALIVALSRAKQDELTDTFARLEAVWDEFDVYNRE